MSELLNAISRVDTVLSDRAKTHGDYKTHATITQSIKFILQDAAEYGKLDFCQRESLEMIAHKIGRIVAGDPDFRDHWIDIAGYAKLVADRCTK